MMPTDDHVLISHLNLHAAAAAAAILLYIISHFNIHVLFFGFFDLQ